MSFKTIPESITEFHNVCFLRQNAILEKLSGRFISILCIQIIKNIVRYKKKK